MEWRALGSYLLMIWQSGWLKQDSLNINAICLCIKSMHHTEKIVLYYVDYCIYWYTPKAIGKWFVENLGKRLHESFLGNAHWFISIRILYMKDHSISLYQDRYATSVVVKYMNNSTVKTSKMFYKTTLTSDMIFTKDDESTSDEQAKNLTRELNIHYRSCIGSLIYLLSTRVYFIFSVQKLETFSSNPGKVNFEGIGTFVEIQ